MCWVWANPRNGGYMTHLVVICIPLLDLLPAPQTASQVSLCCTKWWWQSYAENRRPICSNPHYTDYIWIWIKNDQKIKNLELFDFYFHCCSSPKHLVFYDGLHACRCRCRWSLCTAKGAIPCAASGRVPGCGWFFCQVLYPWTHNCSKSFKVVKQFGDVSKPILLYLGGWTSIYQLFGVH